MNAYQTAIQKWLDWRNALHYSIGSGGSDPDRAMLANWWTGEGLPKLAELSDEQAQRVLLYIAELEWAGRPFTKD